jgi:hypothetical protein
MINVIEDCSPFYIRFVYENLNQFVEYVKNVPSQIMPRDGIYQHHTFNNPKQIFDECKLSEKFTFSENKCAIFETPPGKASTVHKDGTNIQVSINIPVQINDDKCVTRWYDEDLCKDYKQYGLPYTRTIADSTQLKKLPIVKEVVFKENEAILFNVGIYHSFDNSESGEYRKILLLRLDDSNITFDQAKETLYSFQNI